MSLLQLGDLYCIKTKKKNIKKPNTNYFKARTNKSYFTLQPNKCKTENDVTDIRKKEVEKEKLVKNIRLDGNRIV